MTYIELWQISTCAQKSSCLKSKYPSYVSARRVSRYEGRDVRPAMRLHTIGQGHMYLAGCGWPTGSLRPSMGHPLHKVLVISYPAHLAKAALAGWAFCSINDIITAVDKTASLGKLPQTD